MSARRSRGVDDLHHYGTGDPRCLLCCYVSGQKGSGGGDPVVSLATVVRMMLDEQPSVSGAGREAAEGAIALLCPPHLERIELTALAFLGEQVPS